MSTKIDTNLKKAYYYFGFKEIVAYEKVKEHIKILKGLDTPEELSMKINGHADEINEFFSDPELKNDPDFRKKFAKKEPRGNWESYTVDFPKDVFDNPDNVDLKVNVEKTPDETEETKPVDTADDEAIMDKPASVQQESAPSHRAIFEPKPNKTKIYINGELLGYCEDPVNFTNEMREKRRKGDVSYEMNITYYEDNDEIYIFNDPGRARRPLIIVKDGAPLLKEEHLNKVANGKLNWDDLINKGLVEYLDAEEEENSYIAMSLAELNDEHTHLEIDPATMLGICAGIIPFSDHNSSPRNTMEAGMTKQALGLYVSNYALRTDTRAHLLHHPQTPIVKTRIIDSTNYDLRPSGQNFVVHVL